MLKEMFFLWPNEKWYLHFLVILRFISEEEEKKLNGLWWKNQIHFSSHTIQKDLAQEFAALGTFCS